MAEKTGTQQFGTFLRTLGAGLNPQVAAGLRQDQALEAKMRESRLAREQALTDQRTQMKFQLLTNALKNPNLTDEQKSEIDAARRKLIPDFDIPVITAPETDKRSGYSTLQEVVIPDAQGNPVIYKVPFDHRAGKLNFDQKMPVNAEGQIVSPRSPEVRGAIKSAEKGAEVEAKERTMAKIDLPKVKSNARYLKRLVTKAISHPGFEGVVGAPSLSKIGQYIPGTEAAGFRALQKQITGKQFMSAYETLKGGGQITEIEGQKATEALSRMNTAQSEEEYRNAAYEFISEIDRLTDLAEQKAGGRISTPEPQGGWSIRPK